MNTEIPFIKYPELLKQLENSENNHLLLGNGFNSSLGIDTNYENIFSRMLKEEPVYENIEKEMQKESVGYDIEKLIGELEESLKSENENVDKFLNAYIRRKIKFDFMKATSGIVREKIKGIYQEKNRDIHVLFEKFDNYFTLNYDTFLYLLLMKFKEPYGTKNQAVAISNTNLFQREDLNETQNNIYDEIYKAKKEGKIEIAIGKKPTRVALKNATKSHFQTNIEQYKKEEEKEWSTEDIRRVIDKIWEEEAENQKLKTVNDGFQGDLFKEQEILQNVFFLHGSFHIYEKKHLIKKITKEKNQALYQRLAEIIQGDEESIVCILAEDSEEKTKQIDDNQYLKKGFKRLFELSGNIVILGSSLSDNDKHIFQAINESSVETVYISSRKEKKQKDFKQSEKLFPKKKIVLFDYKTISYDVNNVEAK